MTNNARTGTMTSDWLHNLTPETRRPRLRLLCLPCAGGAVSGYRSWRVSVPDDVELIVAQLPGRERRMAEPACTDARTIVTALRTALHTLPSAPLALFGHSLGGSLAHLLAIELTAMAQPPAVLAVAGRSAPRHAKFRPSLNRLDDSQLLAALSRMGGTPAAVLEHQDLMAMLLPILRTDLAVGENIAIPDQPRLSCPVLALAGDADSFAPADEVQAWHETTHGPFHFATMAGGHFFPAAHCRPIIELIRRTAGV